MTTKPLTGAHCLGELGVRPMVRAKPVVRKCWRVEWEYDGVRVFHGDESDGFSTSSEPERRVRVRTFYSRPAAYNWMALRLIYSHRSKFATRVGSAGHPEGCKLCDIELAKPWRGAPDEAPTAACRYHDHGGEHFEQLRKRLARWLRWRDSVLSGGDK